MGEIKIMHKTHVNYTIDEIKEDGIMYSVRLEENGFRETPYKIEKITPKQVHFKEELFFKGTVSKRIDQEYLLNQQLKIGYTSGKGVKTFFISGYALVLKKDIEQVKAFFIREAKAEIDDRIVQLQKQHEMLNKYGKA